MIKSSNRAYYDEPSGKLFVTNARLATVLNKILRSYEDGNYVFPSGSEAIFKVLPNQIKAVAAAIESFK